MNETKTLATANDIGKRIGRAMANDAMADGMPTEWTGLDAQDGDELLALGIDADDPEWAAAEDSAQFEFHRIVLS
jgi:hypothetical protein